MASLESLPAPLPLLIAKALPDLKALDALRRVSALFALIFDMHAAELLEHLMVTTLHEETIIEIRAHVLLVAGCRRWRGTVSPVEHLYESAQSSLPKDVPTEAIALTIRTLSFLHSIGGQVAEEKLQELYALPHRRVIGSFSTISSFYGTEGTPYDVPPPSPLNWIEEQRILKSLFHIRIHALLGLQIQQPPPHPQNLNLWQFSIVYECYRLYENHLPEITRRAIHTTSSSWKAPATRCNEHEQDWPEDLTLTQKSVGWAVFHTRCALRSFGRSPISHTDWVVFSDLGLAIWSHRRLFLELALVHNRRRPGPHPRSPNFAFIWWVLGRARIPAKYDEYTQFEHP